LDRRIGGRAERIEDEQDFVALDELARLLDGFRRAVAVIVSDELILRPLMAPSSLTL